MAKSIKGAGRKRLAPATSLDALSGILRETRAHEVLQRPRSGGEWVPATLETLNLESFNYKVGGLKPVRVSREGCRDYVYFVSIEERSHGPYTMKQAEAMLRSAVPVMANGGSVASGPVGRTIHRGDSGGIPSKPKSVRTREYLHVGCQSFRWAPLLEFMRQHGWDRKKKSTRKGRRK